MKCSGIELASEGLCEDKTKICELGCNNSAVSVEMLLSENISFFSFWNLFSFDKFTWLTTLSNLTY